MIDIGIALGRNDWVEKNREYLGRLTEMQTMLAEKGIIHKSGSMRGA
jgi:hypothetical protein